MGWICHHCGKENDFPKDDQQRSSTGTGGKRMGRETYKDDDPFPFGKHKGTPMCEIPDEYWDWLLDQEWIRQWPGVFKYANDGEGEQHYQERTSKPKAESQPAPAKDKDDIPF